MKIVTQKVVNHVLFSIQFDKFYFNFNLVHIISVLFLRGKLMIVIYLWINSRLWKSFSGVFKRGLVLFSLNNFSRFFIFHISLSYCVILSWYCKKHYFENCLENCCIIYQKFSFKIAAKENTTSLLSQSHFANFFL